VTILAATLKTGCLLLLLHSLIPLKIVNNIIPNTKIKNSGKIDPIK